MDIIPDYAHTEMPVWFTIPEATEIIKHHIDRPIQNSNIYRYVLYGILKLSIYFQSPIWLRKVSIRDGQLVTRHSGNNTLFNLCHLSSNNFLNNKHIMLQTEGPFFSPLAHIMDTPLKGREYTEVQSLLANSLDLPTPVTGQNKSHSGLLVMDDNGIYQVYQSITWKNRITQQLNHIPVHMAVNIHEKINKYSNREQDICLFPIYHFDDCCFVVRQEVLKQFLQSLSPSVQKKTASRISSPLSRLLWLACKNNNDINMLINHPYKLLTVFEQWAAAEGLNEKFSAETLKAALKRGTP